jgi:hypothetical protein
MAIETIRISDRKYTGRAEKLLRLTMLLAFVAYVVVLSLIAMMPEIGLRVLWFAVIPIAPIVLLIAPNAWVSVCPVSTVQTIAHRAGRNPQRRLSARATQNLQVIGWILMLLGIPSRHLVFNSVGLATFWTAMAITGIVLVVGFTFRSLSGWCVGACPIRPIEVLYGQFALDRNRPEKCAICTSCIASCLRLVPEKSHREFQRNPVIANLAMGFPGFVAAYFLLDLLNLCNVEHEFFAGTASSVSNWYGQTLLVYGVMFAGLALSWVVFGALSKWFMDRKRMFRAVALVAFSAYYLGVAPEICEAWNWPFAVVPAILILPTLALVWVTRPRAHFKVA